mgnify:CR=1 FL=1
MTSTSRRTFCLQSLAAGLSAVTLLSGCAVTPQNARVWRGRFSLRITAADGRLENQTGRFELTKTPQFLRLDLLTPLSGILARIEETSRGASFTRSLSPCSAARQFTRTDCCSRDISLRALARSNSFEIHRRIASATED